MKQIELLHYTINIIKLDIRVSYYTDLSVDINYFRSRLE